MGIVMFGFVTLIIPLLLTILPAVFLTFARGVRPVYKVFWVSLSLLPIVADVLLERYRFPKGVFVFSPWAVYLLFLWFGRARVGGRRGWRHYGLALSSVVYVGLMVWFGISVYADSKDAASAHDIYWPWTSLETRT